jgi:hypothetical protein
MEPEKVIDMETGEPEAPPPDMLRDPILVHLHFPVTVDGVTYTQFTLDFHSITRAEHNQIKRAWKSMHANQWSTSAIDEEDFQELYLAKAGKIPVAVLRALSPADQIGLYGKAFRWLAECLDMKTTRTG